MSFLGKIGRPRDHYAKPNKTEKKYYMFSNM